VSVVGAHRLREKMSRGRERDRGQTVYAKPVFAVGGTVSGYGSLGSAESLSPESSAASKDKSVWSSENSQLASTAMTEELQSLSQARASFKSSFRRSSIRRTSSPPLGGRRTSSPALL